MASLAEPPAEDVGPSARDGSGPAAPRSARLAGAKLAGRYRLERESERFGPDGPEADGADSPDGAGRAQDHTLLGPSRWVAFDELLNRKVGVDLVGAAHPRAQAVQDAARDAATVADVRFVQVLDVAEQDGLVYVVTEWISDAADLAQRLAAGPISLARATRIARDVAAAVAQAHSSGLSHGRLNPRAVLLTSTDQVKVLGLRLDAALAGMDQPPPAQGQAEDTRAVGRLWYAELTGLWPGEEAAYGLDAAPRAHGRPYSPTQIRAAIPKAVDQLVVQALAEPGEAEADQPGPAPFADGKALADAIAGLPRLRDEAETTMVVPRSMAQRAAARSEPVHPVAAPALTAPMPGLPGREPRDRPPRATMRRALLSIALAVIVAFAAFAAVEFGGSDKKAGAPPTTSPNASSATTAAPTTAAALFTIAGASIWDSSDGSTDPQNLNDSYDGTDTGWTTSTYVDGPAIAPYRAGTGIIFDLGAKKKVGSVTFSVATAGATTQVLTAQTDMTSPPPLANEAPTGFTVQDTETNVGGSGTVKVTFTAPIVTRFVMIWFTVLPYQSASQYDIAGYKDNLSHVQIYGWPV